MMEKNNLHFVLGGARSGKSKFAENLVSQNKSVLYVATAKAFDDGMKQRIKLHQERRPSDWGLIEAHRDFDKYVDIYQKYDAILFDCISIMINNIMMDENFDFENIDYDHAKKIENIVIDEITKFILLTKDKKVFIVSNEVGFGVAPAYEVGNIYRDISGKVNECIASLAKNVSFIVAGIEMRLK